jgi:sugar transferase (PEP-CTERM/EpsH1 system associated)
MKVLFLSQIVPYPPHGGVLQRGYHLLRELGRTAEVHLLAFVHPDVLATESAVAEGRSALLEFCATVECFSLWPKASRAHAAAGLALSACSRLPFSVIAHRSAAFASRVDELLETMRFDLIHVDTIALSPFVKPPRATPTVLTHHNIESVLMERRSRAESRVFARRFLQREAAKLTAYERRLSPTFDMNIVVSPNDAQVLADLAPTARSRVVANGVDTHYFAPDFTHETPALIYTGGMNMFANRDAVMHFLSEIWPLIRAAEPGVRFFAVGQDPPRELKAIAERDPQVIVTGFVDDIRPLVRQAGVYVVPLRVGGGTRLKVLDAMAMGKALVSTSVGCEGIAVAPGTQLMIADTPDSFAQATVALLRDPARRLALGQAARQLVEQRYAWPVVGAQLLQAYQDAISAKEQSR